MSTPSEGTRSVERREQMLRAAVDVMGEKGFSETRISDVAERAGVSTGLVIYYFATKDDLLIEALRLSEDLVAESTTQALSTLDTAVAKLEYLFEVMCVRDGSAETDCAWGLWFDLWSQAFRVPAVADHRAVLDHRWFDTIAQVVRDGIETGEFGAVDADEFAVRWAALLDGLSIQVALEDDRVTVSRARQAALEIASQWLGFPLPKAQAGAAAKSAASGARVSGGKRRAASGAN